MAEGMEPAEDAEMHNAQDDVAPEQEIPAAQLVDQAMAKVQDDMDLDSRTSMAGRKRNLQETYPDNKAPADGEEHGERSRKRVKDHQDSPLVQEELTTNVTSPSNGGALPSVVDLDPSRRLPASEPNADSSEKTKASAAAFNLVGKSFNVREPATAPVVAPHTWNGGVSGSLRTSFGARPRLTLKPKSTPAGMTEEQETVAQPIDQVDRSSIASATKVKAPAAAPFRELSKAEQDNLSGEEKSLYLKSLFAQLRTPAPSTSASPRITLPLKPIVSAYRADEEIEEVPAPDHGSPQLLQPLPPKTLSKKNKKRLSPEGRAAYNASHEAFRKAWAEYQRLKAHSNGQSEALQTSNPADRPLRRSPRGHAERAAEKAASIAAEFKDWVIDDDGKQAELWERHPLTRSYESTNLDTESADNDDTNSGDKDSSGDLEGSVIANDTNLDDARQTISSDVPAFQFLKKAELRLLSPEERDAYKEAQESYSAARSLQKKQAKQQIQSNAPSEIQSLPEPKSGKKARKLKLATQKAEKAISKSFPLAANGQESEILKSMAKGETAYPRKLVHTPYFVKRDRRWALPEMLSIDGKPLQIFELSFNDFAPYFLSLHPDPPNFSQRMLVAAFHSYLRNYYPQMSGLDHALEKCRATATDNSAITISKAMELANQRLGRQVQPQVVQRLENVNQSQLLSTPADVPRQDSPVHVDGDLDVMLENSADVAPISDKVIEITPHPIDNEEPIDLDVHQAELYLQQRYYPSSDLNTLRCLACGQTGHKALSCPLIQCGVCGTSGVHSEAMCPQKKRCQKCREQGHQSHQCKEKLSLPKSEMSCDICSSTDHLETACHYVWRSFFPRPEEILTVRDILVDCYTCGSLGHFGPECGLHRGTIYSGGITWSKYNLSKYLDPSTQNPMYPASVRSMPARATSNGMVTDPIYIDDSDDGPSFARGEVLPTYPRSGIAQSLPPQPRLTKKEMRKLERQKLTKEKKKENKAAKAKERKKEKKDKGQPRAVHNIPIDSNYHRNPNPPGESRPGFLGSTINNAPPNAPSGPRDNSNNNVGSMNGGGNANRGGGGGQGGRGGGTGGLSRADRRRMADQAGGRAARGGF